MKIISKIFECVCIAFISFLTTYTFFFMVTALTFALTYLIGGMELDIEVCMLNWVIISTISFLIAATMLITLYLSQDKFKRKGKKDDTQRYLWRLVV